MQVQRLPSPIPEMDHKNPEQPDPAIVGTSEETRLAVAKQFIESVVFGQYRQLVAWESVTGQSSQIDSGYLAQQLISLLTGIPGTGSRGKGDDLSDGSEVKAASSLSGMDRPRWNNQLSNSGKIADYLACPAIYFVLFDTVNRKESFPFRIRVWKVLPAKDEAFQQVVRKWAAERTSGNFQLHPPCWRDDNIVTNNAGHLEMPPFFEARQVEVGEIDHMEIKHYSSEPGLCAHARRP